MRSILVCACISVFILSCRQKNDYKTYLHDPITYCKTVYELNTVVMGNNFSPIVASRNYLYANVAAYEVIAAGYPQEYRSLAGQVKGLSELPKPPKDKPIDFEFASLLAFCKLGEAVTFPAGSMQYFVDSLHNLAKDHGMPTDIFNNSVAFADTVSSVVMQWSKKDFYLQTRTYPKYTVMDTPGRWVPTPPAYTSAMEPSWRMIRPVVMDSANQFMPPRPPKFSLDKNSFYFKQVMAIKNAGDSLTEEQKHIAEFWDDNPFKLNVTGHVMFGTKKFSPPGHWMSIVGIAAKKAGFDFNSTVYAYTKTAIALFDGFISCWDEKYRSNVVRPETVINKYVDPEWRPYIQTPPFPSYVSGHSVVSSAACEVMTDIFGDNFSFKDT